MPNEGETRRGFLSFLTTAVMTCLGILLSVPAVAYFWSPLRKKVGEENAGDGFSDAGLVKDLPLGKWQLVSIDVVRQDGWEKTRMGRGVYVRRTGEGSQNVEVLSPTCPHLGCSVSWQAHGRAWRTCLACRRWFCRRISVRRGSRRCSRGLWTPNRRPMP